MLGTSVLMGFQRFPGKRLIRYNPMVIGYWWVPNSGTMPGWQAGCVTLQWPPPFLAGKKLWVLATNDVALCSKCWGSRVGYTGQDLWEPGKVLEGNVFGGLGNPPYFSLPKTNGLPLKIDGWKISFPLGCHCFRCYVSFRECSVLFCSATSYSENLYHICPDSMS